MELEARSRLLCIFYMVSLGSAYPVMICQCINTPVLLQGLEGIFDSGLIFTICNMQILTVWHSLDYVCHSAFTLGTWLTYLMLGHINLFQVKG